MSEVRQRKCAAGRPARHDLGSAAKKFKRAGPATLDASGSAPRSRIIRWPPLGGPQSQPSLQGGCTMRTDFDFSPYYRATVGFDRVFDLLDSVASQNGATGYPPYNIEKADDDTYRIVMAVAGFTEAELNVTQKEGELLVNGKSQPASHEKEYLYRGIAGRDFERRFQLADHVKVLGASLSNGMLTIELKREIPEEKKARAIRIEATPGPKTITQQ